MDNVAPLWENAPTQKTKSFLYAFLGFSLALSVSGALLAGAALFVLGLVEFSRGRKTAGVFSGKLALLILIYVLWGVLVSLVNESTSLRKAFSSQSAFFLFFLILWTAEKKDIEKGMAWFLIGSIIQGMWSLLQQGSGVNFYPTETRFFIPEFFMGWPEGILSELALRNGRAVGSRSHPLTLAEGLIPAFFMGLVWLLQSFKSDGGRGKTRIASVLGLFFLSVGLVLAQGRGVWLGLLVGLLLFLIPFGKKVKVIVLLGLLGVGLVAGAVAPDLKSRFLSVFTSSGVKGSDNESKSIRLGLWEAAIEDIRRKPFMGVGLRGGALTLDPAVYADTRTWREAHSLYIQTAMERGLIGFFLFMIILFFCARAIWNTQETWRWPGLAIFAALLMAGLTESWMRDKEIALIFWAFMGTIQWATLRRPHGSR